jgi:hypothetical protein
MPVFEATGSSDPLGLWDSTPQAFSFEVGDEKFLESAEPVYRVNLPESAEGSSSVLAENLANLERMNAALDEVPFQLDGLVRRVQANQQKAASAISFATVDILPENGPESELLSLLAISDSVAISTTDEEGVSFGLLDEAREALIQAKEKFEGLVDQVNHEFVHFAWVETKIGSQIIARTEVGWNGDSTTVWTEAPPPEQISLHQRTLIIVSRTRNLKLRLLLTVSGGAAKMAALIVTPGGAVLALPAVYQYVIKILAQVRQLQSTQSS